MRLPMTRVFYLFPLCLLLHYLTACSSGSGAVVGDCTLGGGAQVTISGRVTFDLVPHDPLSGALDYTKTAITPPAQHITVEAVCNTVIASTATDTNGYYGLQIPADTNNVFMRVKAEMKATGDPSWNFTVVDNTQSQALYAMIGEKFNTGTQGSAHNLYAISGWTGSSYGKTRVAAPFAILNSINMAVQKIIAVDSTVVFPPLKINWSINNVPVEGDATIGQITTSLYNGVDIFLLGKEDSDTEEYDEHVIIHEFGHYFENKFSRLDSIGGRHGLNDYLDLRVAFSEGFSNAFAAMMTDKSVYIDTSGIAQGNAFSFDIEDNNICINPGWFSECSVQSILYDLYDNTNDSVDSVALGFAPIYSVLINEQKNTAALTSIFSFIHALKTNNSISAGAIDILVSGPGPASSIYIISDEFGSSETHNAGNADDVLPVYTHIAVGAEVSSLCVIDDFSETIEAGVDYNENKLSSYRFLKFTPLDSKAYTIKVDKVLGTDTDPDIVLFQGIEGVVAWAWGTDINTETLTISLTAGVRYIIQINDDDVTFSSSPVGKRCFSVVIK
jgi:hypothetical protein